MGTSVSPWFEAAWRERFPDPGASVVVVGGGDGEGAEDGAAVVLARLAAAGVAAGSYVRPLLSST